MFLVETWTLHPTAAYDVMYAAADKPLRYDLFLPALNFYISCVCVCVCVCVMSVKN
jgi:hypothetical protein